MIGLNRRRALLLAARPHLQRGGWAAVEAIVAPVLMIALSPWLLLRLGPDGFGQWALALAIGGFAHVVSLGAGASTMYAVAASTAKNENRKALDAIKAGFFLALVSVLILVFIAWFVAEPITTAIFSKMGEPATVASVLLFGVWALALQELDAVYAGALRGMQRYDLVALLELLGRPLWALSIAIVAFKTGDVLAVLLVHFFFYAIRLIVRARMVVIVFQQSCFGLPSSTQSVLDILNFGKWISLQSIGGVLFSTMDKVLVGWLFGSGELARYSICLQVTQFLHSVQAAGLQVITPWVARKKLEWSPSIAKQNLLRLCVWAGMGSLLLPIAFLGGSWLVLRLWMGVAFATSNVGLLRVLLVGTTILAFTIPGHYVLLGLGKAKFTAILLVVAGLISLMSSVSLAGFGLIAFAVGRLMYGAIACLYFIPLLRINLKDFRGE